MASPLQYWSCRAERCDRRERVPSGCAARSILVRAGSDRGCRFCGGLSTPGRRRPSGRDDVSFYGARSVLGGVPCSMGRAFSPTILVMSSGTTWSRDISSGMPETVGGAVAEEVSPLRPDGGRDFGRHDVISWECASPHPILVMSSGGDATQSQSRDISLYPAPAIGPAIFREASPLRHDGSGDPDGRNVPTVEGPNWARRCHRWGYHGRRLSLPWLPEQLPPLQPDGPGQDADRPPLESPPSNT